MYILNNNVTYCESFKKLVGNKNAKGSIITKNIFRIQAYDSVISGHFCIGFINFMLAGKTLTGFTNLFSPNNFEKNNDIILNLCYV